MCGQVPTDLHFQGRQIVPHPKGLFRVCLAEGTITVAKGRGSISLLRLPQRSAADWVALMTETYFLRVLRLEVQDQVAYRVPFLWDLSPGLAGGCKPSRCLLTGSSLCACTCGVFPCVFLKVSGQTGVWPTLIASLYLNYPFKGRISPNSHILR